MVSRPAWHASDLGSITSQGMLYFRCNNLALNSGNCVSLCLSDETLGLYREYAIAIEGEARDPFGCNAYYVTMQITFHIPEFARKVRNLHCDLVHITTVWVFRLVLDHAIAVIQTLR